MHVAPHMSASKLTSIQSSLSNSVFTKQLKERDIRKAIFKPDINPMMLQYFSTTRNKVSVTAVYVDEGKRKQEKYKLNTFFFNVQCKW